MPAKSPEQQAVYDSKRKRSEQLLVRLTPEEADRVGFGDVLRFAIEDARAGGELKRERVAVLGELHSTHNDFHAEVIRA